jgi:1,4-alpha-glucan branching enzyme
MIHKSHSSHSNHVRITFELPSCIWADRIFLVGDFNDWCENATPMRQERDGVWRTTLDLPYGNRYEFRYMIDGQWKTDSHADGYATNRFGTENSVVIAMLPDSARLERANSQIWESQNLSLPSTAVVNAALGQAAQRTSQMAALPHRARARTAA